jgi:hypothetical protein
LVVVSDSPGRTDVQLRRQLAGAGGKFLFVELSKVGIKEQDCYVTSAALCRGEGDKEDERAAECCAPRLLRELGSQRGVPASTRTLADSEGRIPVPFLLLGKAPCRTVLGVRKAGHARGFVWEIPETKVLKAPAPVKEGSKRKARVEGEAARLKRETGEARNALRTVGPVIPSLALSFILKADSWVSVFRRDLARIARVAAPGASPKDFHEEGGPPDRIGGNEVLEALGAEVTCDIETDGINPRKCGILCVGFADLKTGRVAVLWPWHKGLRGNLAKWLGERKRVVFHNGFNFDLLVLRAHHVAW